MITYLYITYFLNQKNMEKMKSMYKAIKAWDEKNTNFPSWLYMAMFLTASALFLANLNQAAAAL